jgi:hypothetical protein
MQKNVEASLIDFTQVLVKHLPKIIYIYKCTIVQMYRYTIIHLYDCTKKVSVQLYKCTEISKDI